MSVNGTLRFIFAISLAVLSLCQAQDLRQQLHFHNGDRLHGKLMSINSDLQWQVDEAFKHLEFPAKEVSHLVFETARPLGPVQHGFRVELVTGDQIVGTLRALDQQAMILETGFAGVLTIPRSLIHSAQAVLGPNQQVYQGPKETGEWQVGYRGKNWQFRDGSLVSEGYSSTGLDPKIPECARIELDVALRDDPTLNVFLCADNPQNGGDSYYYLQLTPNVINFQRYWRDHPRTYINLNKTAESPEGKDLFLEQPNVHLTIDIDRANKHLALSINGKFFARYTDPAPKAPAGSAMILASYGSGEVQVRDVKILDLKDHDQFLAPPLKKGDVRFSNKRNVHGSVKVDADGVSVAGKPYTLDDLRAFRLSEDRHTDVASSSKVYLANGSELIGRVLEIDSEFISLKHPRLEMSKIARKQVSGLLLPSRAPDTPAPTGSGRVLFKNGDTVTGDVVAWDAEKGLRVRPGGKDTELNFPPKAARIAYLSHPEQAAVQKDHLQARVALGNKDILLGHLTAISDTHLTLHTPLADALQIPREAVQTIHFEDPGIVHYRGPDEHLQDWTLSTANARWEIEQGVMTARALGGIGKGTPMPKRGQLDVTLSWDGHLAASISVFCQDLTKPVQAKSYRLYCENRSFSLFRGLTEEEANNKPNDAEQDRLRNLRLEEQLERFSAEFGGGAARRLGSPIPVEYNAYKRARHLTLCWNEANGQLALLMDGKLLRSWTDPLGLVSPSHGLIFHQHAQSSTLKIESIAIRDWNGVLPEPALDADTLKELRATVVHLKNQDLLEADALALSESKPLQLQTPLGNVAVPLSRIASLTFPPQSLEFKAHQGMALEGFYPQSGSCRFFLHQIEGGRMTISSPSFGQHTLSAASFRRLHFDLQDKATWQPTRARWDHPAPPAMRWALQQRLTETPPQAPPSNAPKRVLNESVELDE